MENSDNRNQEDEEVGADGSSRRDTYSFSFINNSARIFPGQTLNDAVAWASSKYFSGKNIFASDGEMSGDL